MQQNKQPKPYALDELRHKYEVGELTVEQLCGQLLIWSQITHEIAVANQRNQEGYDDDLADLAAQVAELKEVPPEDM